MSIIVLYKNNNMRLVKKHLQTSSWLVGKMSRQKNNSISLNNK